VVLGGGADFFRNFHQKANSDSLKTVYSHALVMKVPMKPLASVLLLITMYGILPAQLQPPQPGMTACQTTSLGGTPENDPPMQPDPVQPEDEKKDDKKKEDNAKEKPAKKKPASMS
jgi:hypothetical protein